MLFSLDLTVSFLILFVFSRLEPLQCFHTKIFEGLRFLTAPSVDDLENTLPTKKMRDATKRSKIETLPNEVEVLVGRNQGEILHGSYHPQGRIGATVKENQSFYFAHRILFNTTVLVTLVYFISSAWNGLKGTEPRLLVTGFLLGAAGVAIVSLVALLKEEGDMPHVRNAVLVGLGGGFIALFTLLAPGEALDFSIKQGFMDFIVHVQRFTQPEEAARVAGPMKQPNFLGVQLVLALLAALVSALMYLPVFYYTREYYDFTTRTEHKGAVKKVLAHAAFYMPMAIVVTWIRPLMMPLLLASDAVKCSGTAIARDCVVHEVMEGEWFLTETQWFALRLWLILVFIVLRIYLARRHLQAFLWTVRQRLVAFLTKHLISEAKSDTLSDRENTLKSLHMDSMRLCKLLLYRVCFASVLYFAPLVIMYTLVLLASSRGDTPLGFSALVQQAVVWMGGEPSALQIPEESRLQSGLLEQRMWDVAVYFSPDIEKMGTEPLLIPNIVRPVLSFLLWWIFISQFIISAFALFWFRLAIPSQRANDAAENNKAGDDSSASGSKPTENKKKAKKGKKKQQ